MSCDISLSEFHTLSSTQYNPCLIVSDLSSTQDCAVDSFDCVSIDPDLNWYCVTKNGDFTTCATTCPDDLDNNHSCVELFVSNSSRIKFPAQPAMDESTNTDDLQYTSQPDPSRGIFGTTLSAGFVISLLTFLILSVMCRNYSGNNTRSPENLAGPQIPETYRNTSISKNGSLRRNNSGVSIGSKISQSPSLSEWKLNRVPTCQESNLQIV